MNFDRNTIIGFAAMMVLLFGYIFFTQRQQGALEAEKQKTADSLAKVEAAKKKLVDTAVVRQQAAVQDSTITAQAAGEFQPALAEELTVVENELMKVSFTNKGGYPKSVELKNYKRYDGKQVVLGGDAHQLIYSVNTANNKAALTSQLNFINAGITKTTDGQTITFRIADSAGKSIEHIYTIKNNSYLIDWNVQLKGADKLLTQGILNLNWDITAKQQEKDLKYEKGQSNLGYMEEGDYDFEAAGTGDTKKFGDKTKWVGVKQQFFNTTILAGSTFAYGESTWAVPEEKDDSLQKVMDVKSVLRFNLAGASQGTIPMQLYYGPNDFHTLKAIGNKLESHVQLGYGIFAFVKYINRFVVMPVFDFFDRNIGSMGIVILLLTFFIRLIISPLTYSSYLSGAKMKVLRPEIDELKKKHGSDQQAMSMEQMKLFRQAGVNPLGGCIPALLQIPIFFALYSFFNANIGLRGESFLWAKDLSSYDTIATLPFNIPFYGDHVSLFTITATITSLLISVYNMQMTPTQDNPVMKYMIYFFPIMLLFIFNSLPSALTWYYTVSNIVTLGLQFVIQKFIINEEKIHAKLQENKKKPVTKSKWQERLEQVQQSNQKVQDMQKKQGGKK
ncbi:membrane protein insertase YidC [Lacibacter sediminis]|uniref:Membrane protein insertase YidC n=1 Tax=Lacibacter sediminis TaxID=2760713 RepID=A0A7G5XCR8_9BACT|nr:membrane protein insertase YidC [Lacibacter sediminis]QNA43271.1 membrane protein insertase YidC [Lacibacter sediminis]